MTAQATKPSVRRRSSSPRGQGFPACRSPKSVHRKGFGGSPTTNRRGGFPRPSPVARVSREFSERGSAIFLFSSQDDVGATTRRPPPAPPAPLTTSRARDIITICN